MLPEIGTKWIYVGGIAELEDKVYEIISYDKSKNSASVIFTELNKEYRWDIPLRRGEYVWFEDTPYTPLIGALL